jgi:ethanolamine ammonia-lyase large subunit
MNPDELRSTFVLAAEFKEGDLGLGGTSDERLRAEARRAIAALRVGEIAPSAFVDDAVSEVLVRSLDASLAAELAPLTIADLKRLLLGPDGSRWAGRNQNGLGPEVIAAVV